MPRLLAIDHGDARIGLALSDDLGMFAHPLETIWVAKQDPIARIVEVVIQHKIATIVLGMPFRMDGTEGTAVAKVRDFAEQLQEKLGEGVTFVEVDERLSTKTAQEQLHSSGRKVKDSRAVIDQAAAAVILQDYLDSQAPPVILDPWAEDDDADWEEPNE